MIDRYAHARGKLFTHYVSIEQLRETCANSYTVHEVAGKLHTSPATVAKYISLHDIKLKSSEGRPSAGKSLLLHVPLEDIKHAVETSRSLKEASRTIGVCTDTLKRVCLAYNIPLTFVSTVFSVPLEELIKAEEEAKSFRDLAALMGVCMKTLWNYYKKIGRPTPKYGQPEKRPPRENLLEKWMAAHPGMRLPVSTKDIAEMTGIKYGTVSSCLKKLRKEILAEFAKVDLKALPSSILYLPDGRKIPLKAIASYRYALPYLTGGLHVEIETYSGAKYFCVVDIRYWRDFLSQYT